MLIIKRTLLVLLLLIVGALLVLWLGARASLDGERAHTRQTATLPEFDGSAASPVRIVAGEQTFRARVAGFQREDPEGSLMLLHGFPETSAMWIPLIDAAGAAGYRVVAFDQRGYSPGARPDEVSAYAMDRLSEDVFNVADAVGFERFHLVGHDWGSAVGWNMVLGRSDRIQTWTSLSIPHIAAFGAALQSDPDQQQRSSYMLLFRTPWLPEQLFAFNGFALLGSLYAEHGDTQRDEYLAVLSEPGGLSGALNWYRAAAPSPASATDLHVTIPVLFIWGSRDPAVGRATVDGQRQYMPEEFSEVELDAGHWLMESHGELISEAVLNHLERHGGS
jgi:pimeloyl-ACP methyl ester carboxylesterase